MPQESMDFETDLGVRSPHNIISAETRKPVKDRCPGCGWGFVNSGWQHEGGQLLCRRCGYSSKLGHKGKLPNRAKVLSPMEAAGIVGVSRRTIYTWIINGWLRGHRIGGRWFVTAPDLDLFTKACKGATGKPMPQLWEKELAELWAKE